MAQNQDFFKDAFSEIQKENQSLEQVNFLVAGKSGVGKSTLINTIFGEELTKTGVGKPVTDAMQLIEKENFPVRIYDTVGFELKSTAFKAKDLLKNFKENDLKKFIKKAQSTADTKEHLHVIWYLISGTSARIEESEIEFIQWLVKKDLPVVVVLTKSYDQTEATKLKEAILSYVPEIKEVVLVLAQKTDHLEAFGMEELVEKTFAILPQGLQASFVHAQEASLKLKKQEAHKLVHQSMAANFGVGFVPIPLADAPIMATTQTTMLAKITSLYGVDVDKQQVETALAGVLGVQTAITTGKSLASNVAKLIPGIGTIGGGLISGSVGMVVTGALGYAYVELMELVLQGRVNLTQATPKEITDLLMGMLPKYLPKDKK